MHNPPLHAMDYVGPVLGAAVFVSMRLLAEEQQTGTINLLYSSPVRDGEIIAGKFLSASREVPWTS